MNTAFSLMLGAKPELWGADNGISAVGLLSSQTTDFKIKLDLEPFNKTFVHTTLGLT